VKINLVSVGDPEVGGEPGIEGDTRGNGVGNGDEEITDRGSDGDVQFGNIAGNKTVRQ